MPIYLPILIQRNWYKLILSQSSVPFMYNDILSYFYKSLILKRTMPLKIAISIRHTFCMQHKYLEK